MSNFNPNLPVNNVKTVVMSCIDREICNSIEKMGIEIVPTEKLNCLLPFEQTHADMQIFHYDKNTVFILKECSKLKKRLLKYFKNVVEVSSDIIYKYPNNVLLNCVSLNDKIICNQNTIDMSLIELFEQNKDYIYNVRQGYTKCSICIVSENALITSDKSIYKSVKEDFDVLLIKPGYIDLPGTSYGFIGGCSCKINSSLLAFTGNINLHPDGKNIKDFCFNHRVNTYCLTNKTLLDVGSIIPIN